MSGLSSKFLRMFVLSFVYTSSQPNGLGLLELHCSSLEHNWLQLEHPWEGQLLPIGNTGIPMVLLDYTWKHPCGNLLNAVMELTKLVTPGIPLETY
jgi:hypothetical protein